jgi:hypothetical protein
MHASLLGLKYRSLFDTHMFAIRSLPFFFFVPAHSCASHPFNCKCSVYRRLSAMITALVAYQAWPCPSSLVLLDSSWMSLTNIHLLDSMWWSASLGFKIDGPIVSLGGVHLFPIQLHSFVYPYRSITMFQRMTIWKCPLGISLLSIASRDHFDHDCLWIILPPVWSECTRSLIICLWTTLSSVHWFII